MSPFYSLHVLDFFWLGLGSEILTPLATTLLQELGSSFAQWNISKAKVSGDGNSVAHSGEQEREDIDSFASRERNRVRTSFSPENWNPPADAGARTLNEERQHLHKTGNEIAA